MFDDLFGSAGSAVSDFFGAASKSGKSSKSSESSKSSKSSPAEDTDTSESTFAGSLTDLGNGLSEEGFGGLLDPLGVIDRQEAQRELSDRFDIVDDAYTGPRLPNQVTEDEYSDIARTFSDIRRGHTDIQIDSSLLTDADPVAQSDQRDAFEDDMMSDIADIMQSESGRQLVGDLADNRGLDHEGNEVSRVTRLEPRLVDGIVDSSNAETENKDVYAERFVDRHGMPGRGSTAVDIEFNPGVTVADTPGRSQLRSDVALYHEMVHAHDFTHGTADQGDVKATDGTFGKLLSGEFGSAFDSFVDGDSQMAWDARQGVYRTEHQAAGLGLYASRSMSENAYRSERNQIALGGRGREGDAEMSQRNRYHTFSPDFL